MSKNITLKINSAKETLETVEFNTAGNDVVRIQAQPNVNYEFTDQATGFGPENIMTKRVGNDLHLAFEGSDIAEPDMVIEGYYEQDSNSLLIGQHENGNFYPYVPESGQVSDAVTMLADEVFAGQALGGEIINSALWAFNPLWLLGIAALAGGIAAAASGGGGNDNNTPAEPQPAPQPADTTPPDAPTAAVSSDGKTVSGTAEPGSTVTVHLPDGSTQTTTADENGNYSVDLDTPLTNGETVTVTATDGSGNTSTPTPATAPSAPDAPVITANQDGSVTITPDTDATSQTVTYTDENGTTQTVTFTKDPTTGEWVDGNPNDPVTIDPQTGVVTIPGTEVKGGTTVTATNTNDAGTATSTETSADTDAPSATFDEDNGVVITADANNDGFINKAEKDADTDGKSDVTVNFDGAEEGDIVVLKDSDGNEITRHPLTAEEAASGTYTFPNAVDIPESGEVKVTAQFVDAAGNEGNSAEDSAVVDTEAPSATFDAANGVMIVADTDNNGFINKAEKDAETDGKSDVTVNFDGAVAGDIVVLKDSDGNEIARHPLTAEEAASGTYTFPNAVDIPESGEVKVTAQFVDAAGNEGNSAEDSAVVDTTAPGANFNTDNGVVIVADSNNDGIINKAEKDADTDSKSDITVNFSGANAGDIVVLKDSDGNEIARHPLTAEEAASGTYTFPNVVDIPTTGEIKVTAQFIDAAGNEGNTGEDSATVDAEIDAPIVSIAKDNGRIEPSDVNNGVTTATVSLPPTAKAGDKLTVVDQDGNVLNKDKVDANTPDVSMNDYVLTEEDIAQGSITVTVKPTEPGTETVVTATLTDPVGNTATGSNKAISAVDVTPNEPEQTETPTVTVTNGDTNGDGADDTSTISGKTEPNAEVTITLPGGETVTVTADENGDYTTDVPVLPEGETVTVVAKAPEKTPSEPTTTTVPAVDTTPNEPEQTETPTVTVTNGDTNGDGADDTSTISGKTEPNAEVTITLPGGETVTVTADENGDYTTDVPVLPEGETVTVVAKAPEKTPSEPTTTTVPAVDTTPNEPEQTETPTVTVTNGDTNGDGADDTSTISGKTEPNAEVTITLPGGETVTVTADENGDYTTDVPVLPEGETVTVVAKAPEKTPSEPTTTTVPAVDTTPNEPEQTETPTVTVTNGDTNGDGADDTSTISGKTEPNAEVTITLPGGETVTVTADENGDYTTDVPVLPEGETVTVVAKAPEKTPSEPTTTTVPAVDTTPNEPEQTETPTVTVTNGDTNGDGADDTSTISGKTEPNAEVTITLPGGETVTVTADENGDYTTDVPVLPEGETVTVVAKAPEKTPSEPTTTTVPAVDTTPNEPNTADQPVITASDTDGSVTVTPGDDNEKVDITFTGEDDQPKTVTVTKDPNTGEWTITDPNNTGATVNPTTGVVTIPQDAVKDGSPVNAKGTDDQGAIADADPVNAGTDSKNAEVDDSDADGDGNPDGVVTTTPVNEGENIVTTVKLTNNNGVDNLTVARSTDSANDADFDDAATTYSNGVTRNADGTLNVPAGVTEFTITTPVVADTTTEGAETVTYTVGGVKGNEATINDTSVTPAQPVNLRVALEDDTFGANTRGTNRDGITKDPDVLVTGTGGQAWEYTTNGGLTWNDGGTGDGSFKLPNNDEMEGWKHNVQARLKDDTSVVSNNLATTYDHVTPSGYITVGRNNDGTYSLVARGLEPGAYATVNGGNGRTVNDDGIVLIPNLALSSSTFGNVVGRYSYDINITDIAGNTARNNATGADAINLIHMPNIYTRDGLVGGNSTGQNRVNDNVGSGNDVVIVGAQGGTFGNVGMGTWIGPYSGVDLNFGAGNDSLIAHTIQQNSGLNTNIDMGTGNDSIFLEDYILVAGGGSINVNMGDGNDLFDTGRALTGEAITVTSTGSANIDMGNGDDTFVLSGSVSIPGGGKADVNGGNGWDTILFDSTIDVRGARMMEIFRNFEQIDLQTDNVLGLNGSAAGKNQGQWTIDGVTYNGLFIQKAQGYTGTATIDLGANGGNASSPNLGTFSAQPESQAPDGYTAYRSSDTNATVYIQDGIIVI